MKQFLKIFLSLLLFSFFTSCNDRLEGDAIESINAVKIDSVKIANSVMDVYTTQTIKTFSNYSQTCEGFYGYDYLHTEQFEREVFSYKFKTENTCGDEQVRASQINFRPQEPGIYTFKFWTGKNASGENTYLEEQIVVN